MLLRRVAVKPAHFKDLLLSEHLRGVDEVKPPNIKLFSLRTTGYGLYVKKGKV